MPQIVSPPIQNREHGMLAAILHTVGRNVDVRGYLAGFDIGHNILDRHAAEGGKRLVTNGRGKLQNLLQAVADDLHHTLLVRDGVRNVHHIAEHIADLGRHELGGLVCKRDPLVPEQIDGQHISGNDQINAGSHNAIGKQSLPCDRVDDHHLQRQNGQYHVKNQ